MRLLVFFLLAFAPLVDAASDLDALMQKLQARYRSLITLKADFTQSYESKRFSDKLIEKGNVTFKKGGFMRWEYQSPEKKVFVSDGRHFYYYVPADKQVVKAPVAESEDQHSPTLFLAGRGDFLDDFRAEWADPRPGSHLVKLTPNRPQPDFDYLIVDVDPVRGLVQRLLVVDSYENRTEYAFTKIQENPEVSSSFFAFQPPPGTDVVFQRESSDKK